MKFIPFAILAVFLLTGCQHKSTMEEAQEACAKKGGLLAVIYTTKITASGPGPEEASPGDCLSPKDFDPSSPPPPATPAPPAPQGTPR